jgi:L-amino acid N-acyltransferase YncA
VERNRVSGRTNWQDRFVLGQRLSDEAMRAAEAGNISSAIALMNEANRLRSDALDEKWAESITTAPNSPD